ncbi:DNA repair protein RecO, partial [bacterium]|nr:DNA repair protein RecO [bacterium]
MTFTCRGIILKIENFRESDYLLDFYSEEHGKLEIIVQGARKIKSKLVGLCQPFVLLNLVIASGKRNHLIGGKGIKYFRNIWTNYQKIKYAKNILDLA